MIIRVNEPWGPPLTLEMAKFLTPNDHLCYRFLRRTGRTKKDQPSGVMVRVSGQPQTWKRSPERVRVPWKYGMYESGAVNEGNLGDFTLCDGLAGPEGQHKWLQERRERAHIARVGASQRRVP